MTDNISRLAFQLEHFRVSSQRREIPSTADHRVEGGIRYGQHGPCGGHADLCPAPLPPSPLPSFLSFSSPSLPFYLFFPVIPLFPPPFSPSLLFLPSLLLFFLPFSYFSFPSLIFPSLLSPSLPFPSLPFPSLFTPFPSSSFLPSFISPLYSLIFKA